jgi:hypothetical protein
MTKREAIRQYQQEQRLAVLGFNPAEAETLRRISMTLSHWSEAECNGEITVDDETGQAYRQYGHNGGPFLTVKCPNREAGAIRRLRKILKSHPGFATYYQMDPRGAALYIYRPDDLEPGQSIDSVYSSIGICVY